MLCNLHRGKVLVVHAFSAKEQRVKQMPAASVDSIGQTSNIKQASNKQKVAG